MKIEKQIIQKYTPTVLFPLDMICAGNKTLMKREQTLLLAYSTTAQEYKRYRRRVKWKCRLWKVQTTLETFCKKVFGIVNRQK